MPPLRSESRHKVAGQGPGILDRGADYRWSPDQRTLHLGGCWTTPTLAHLGELPVMPGPGARTETETGTETGTGTGTGQVSGYPAWLTLDGSLLLALDTAGALQLHRLVEALEAQGSAVQLSGFAAPHLRLLALVRERLAAAAEDLAALRPAATPPVLARVGQGAWERLREGLGLLSFLGETALAFLHVVAHPRRLRWRQMLQVVELDGWRALPVLGMLSFLVGVVIAYQSGVQLRLYGGNLYVVDLVTLTVLRELGPLMTAIVVAGRSGSAYAAQIGTMMVTDEIDALRSIGVSPLELLVLPKALGLILALPLLTVFANLAAVVGGMVMSALMLDLVPGTFIRRIPEAVSLNTLMTGLAKAPVFAAAIALVGCYQGFLVRDGADSVGRHTTTSVVQAIVWVIVIDAAFSVVYSKLGI